MMASGQEPSSSGSKNKLFLEYNDEDQTFDTYFQTAQDTRPRKVPRTAEEIEQAFPYIEPEPFQPEPLPQATLDLYQRAIDDPDSITESERLRIHDFVTEDVVEERCQKAWGVAWKELVSKAGDNPAELTLGELTFVQFGRSTAYGDSEATHAKVFGKLLQPEDVVSLW